jgi:hypothetical protein
MRKIIVFLIVVFGVAWVSYADAALVFNADFAQDGTYDTSWPMKAGEVVTVDIYVSNVPAPGLISMGFKLTYDSSKLEVVTSGTTVETTNWPAGQYTEFIDATGDIDEIDMSGFRFEGLAGNNIRLGTVTFRCVSEGTSAFMLLDRVGDWFVLDSEEEIVIDGDIGPGVLLTTIRPPILGDVNGDGLVDLADAIVVLKVMAQIDQGDAVHVTGDVNGDGKIGLAEASYAFQKAAGLR